MLVELHRLEVVPVEQHPLEAELESSPLSHKLNLLRTRFLFEFTAPLFQDTLLRMLGVLEIFSLGGATGTPLSSETRVGA
ncbi:hypothetical protein KY284_005384 [Solanum tuberosum]|nr:hypothetical protein KY284_005384 [Solanum tuberosum]